MGKCEVCGKESETFVASSSCGAVSFAYCRECLTQGIEPYDALVGMGLYYADIGKSYKEKILLPSLKFYGKTTEEFDADVKKSNDEYIEWAHQQQQKDDELESELELC